MAQGRFLLGYADVEQGNFSAAREPLEEALRRFRELGDEHYEGIVSWNLASAYEETGEPNRAREFNEENLRRAEARGDDRIRFFILSSLANDAGRRGQVGDALSMIRESMRIAGDLGDEMHAAIGLVQMSTFLEQAAESELAATVVARGLRTFEDTGLDLPVYLATRRDKLLAAVGQQLDEDALARARARAQPEPGRGCRAGARGRQLRRVAPLPRRRSPERA